MTHIILYKTAKQELAQQKTMKFLSKITGSFKLVHAEFQSS